MPMLPSTNAHAREARHAKINFEEGFYSRAKKERDESFKRFFKRVSSILGAFLICYFASYQFVVAGPMDEEEIFDATPVLSTSEVYVLQDNGFVMKPSMQTSDGDRSSSNEVISYTIEDGDTLSGIANKFSIKVKTITDNNPSIGKVLHTGQKITIIPVDGLTHTVAKGESLEKIAKDFSTNIDAIKKQNKLISGDIKAGMTLILPGAKKVIEEPKVDPNKNKMLAKKRGKGLFAPSAPGSYSGPISGNYIWPCNGNITQYYHRGHYAIDIANRNRGPIYATASGTVLSASYGWNGGYGNVVIIDHGNGITSLYAHNEKLYVKPGDRIGQGQTIAWMGNSGRVYGGTGIHSHFEIAISGVKKNPLAYIGSK